MKNIIILVLLILAGCATSATSVGVNHASGKKIVGMVADSDGKKAAKFIEEFHGYLAAGHWEAVFGAFDNKLQNVVGKTELKNAFAKIDATYGQEAGWAIAPNAMAEVLKKMQVADEAKTADAFMYYEYVETNYTSKRKLTNLIYVIGLTRPEKKADLRVNSLQIFRENDYLNKNFKPILTASVAYGKLMP